MELILDLLRRLPDYPRLRAALEGAQAVGVSGAAQINRSHLIAALCRDTARPAVVVCQDEMAARRTQSELAAFLGAEAPILPTRDLMFYDASAISRGWEQKRLRCLYDLARGKTPLLLTTLEAFSLRTMPRAQLFSAAMRLLPGAQLELDELISRLLHAGYSRCSLVEGAGQFSVRGGIVDIFSPAEERPVRLEFFGDEIDTMGYFDPVTQRRVENADELVILPVAETLPALHPGGIEGLARELDGLLARQRRRKTPNEALLRTLQADADALRGGLASFDKKLRGFVTNEALVVGVESRTSSPVRIPRDPATLMHPQTAGLFPAGEGAGYAGGIISAAIDGERCADRAADYLAGKP